MTKQLIAGQGTITIKGNQLIYEDDNIYHTLSLPATPKQIADFIANILNDYIEYYTPEEDTQPSSWASHYTHLECMSKWQK